MAQQKHKLLLDPIYYLLFQCIKNAPNASLGWGVQSHCDCLVGLSLAYGNLHILCWPEFVFYTRLSCHKNKKLIFKNKIYSVIINIFITFKLHNKWYSINKGFSLYYEGWLMRFGVGIILITIVDHSYRLQARIKKSSTELKVWTP